MYQIRISKRKDQNCLNIALRSIVTLNTGIIQHIISVVCRTKGENTCHYVVNYSVELKISIVVNSFRDTV